MERELPAPTSPPPVLEWRIENFSCWMKLAHGVCITCCEQPLVLNDAIRLSLYPRDIDGRDERMHISFSGPNVVFRDEGGTLLYVGPDGSLLYTQPVRKVIGRIHNQYLGPNFKNVVSQIQKNEDLHGDHLIIRFQYAEPAENHFRMRTTLAVQDASLQITRPNPSHPGSKVTMASIAYHNGRYIDDKERMLVVYDTVQRSLYLNPMQVNTIIPVQVSVRYDLVSFNRSNALVTHREGEIHFRGFPEVFDLTSCLEEGGRYILRLKIINGTYRSRCDEFIPSTSPVENASETIDKAVDEKSADDSFSLSGDLRLLYQDGEFSDFQLKCENVSFPVHRIILSARSPVFKTMLSTDMKEAATGSVDIEDIDPSTLRLFLAFLYTDSFKDVPCDSALKLYYAAHKYQVPALQKKCADFLCNNVCVSNVCDILSLGDRHEDDRLTSVAQNFILKHHKDVLGSEEWVEFSKNDPCLLLKTLTHLISDGKFVHLLSK